MTPAQKESIIGALIPKRHMICAQCVYDIRDLTCDVSKVDHGVLQSGVRDFTT